MAEHVGGPEITVWVVDHTGELVLDSITVRLCGLCGRRVGPYACHKVGVIKHD